MFFTRIQVPGPYTGGFVFLGGEKGKINSRKTSILCEGLKAGERAQKPEEYFYWVRNSQHINIWFWIIATGSKVWIEKVIFNYVECIVWICV